MEKRTRSVVCDECKTELTQESSYPASYGLVLGCEDFNVNNTGTVYAVHIEPPLKRKFHFCGLKCLGAWASRAAENT